MLDKQLQDVISQTEQLVDAREDLRLPGWLRGLARNIRRRRQRIMNRGTNRGTARLRDEIEPAPKRLSGRCSIPGATSICIVCMDGDR